MDNRKLVISLDYGTSASAAAYRFVNHRGRDIPRDTRTIETWPGHGESNQRGSGKVPSKFAYGAENNVDRDSWGFEVTEDMTSCSWTKLALEASANGRVPDERGLGNGVIHVPLGKQAHSVVSDYLRRLHEHIWSLEPLRSIGNLEVEYILTFPASFSKDAQQAIVAAAEHAGFRRGTRKLLTESEAAAGYVFEQGLLGEMKAGEKVMVVDLGGGTSDVSTYIALGVQNGLQLQEWTRPQSRNVGGTNIDRNFSSLLTARFDPEFAALPPHETGPSSRLMREFEDHKRVVTDGDGNAQQIRIALPMDPVDPNPLYFDEDYSEIIISMDDWRTVFNPVLEEIIAFIQDRYNAASGVQYIVLVGGLVNLPWIREAFRSIFNAEHISVSLIFSPEPELAVARGAIWHAVHNTPFMVSCALHYGVGNLEGDRINWLLHKGERYAAGHTAQVQFCYIYKTLDLKRVPIAVYGCNRPSSPISAGAPGVSQLGMFLLDLSTLNFANIWHREDGHGRTEYDIKFKLEIECNVGKGVLCIRALKPDGCLIGEEMELAAEFTCC